MVCAPSEHDFGLVHTDSKAQITIFVSNPTEVAATWKIVHVPVVPPKISVIAAETEELPILPEDDQDVFAFSEYSGRQQGPALPLTSAAACLPMDENRMEDAVFAQSITKVTWNAEFELAQHLRKRNTENPKSPRPLVVTFRPKRNVAYQCRYRFEVEHGEGFDVVLSGMGTYEEGTKPNPPPRVGPRMYDGF
uniref:Uncharacterized protein n=1 Tax=Rhizochromulina marina TaxID=1034831 RepID=A0A7S2RRU6_9STRA